MDATSTEARLPKQGGMLKRDDSGAFLLGHYRSSSRLQSAQKRTMSHNREHTCIGHLPARASGWHQLSNRVQ